MAFIEMEISGIKDEDIEEFRIFHSFISAIRDGQTAIIKQGEYVVLDRKTFDKWTNAFEKP